MIVFYAHQQTRQVVHRVSSWVSSCLAKIAFQLPSESHCDCCPANHWEYQSYILTWKCGSCRLSQLRFSCHHQHHLLCCYQMLQYLDLFDVRWSIECIKFHLNWCWKVKHHDSWVDICMSTKKCHRCPYSTLLFLYISPFEIGKNSQNQLIDSIKLLLLWYFAVQNV